MQKGLRDWHPRQDLNYVVLLFAQIESFDLVQGEQ